MNTPKPLRLDLALALAYLNTLFTLARHGGTFTQDAHSMILDVSLPDVQLQEFFHAIDRSPANAFEAHVKQCARQALK
jgi:hypothetical protein